MQGWPALTCLAAAVLSPFQFPALEPCDGEAFCETGSPRCISSIEVASIYDLAANQAGRGPQVFTQSCGDTETQDGSATSRDGSLDKIGEPGWVAAAHHGFDVG